MSENSTAKEKLLGFLQLKNKFLRNTPLEFSDEDFTELESWSVEDCAKVIGRFRSRPLNSDGGLCPWCLVRYEYNEQDNFYGFDVNDNCDGCGFGERHGFCDDDGSDYSEFILRFNSVGGYLGIEKVKRLIDYLTEED